MRYLYSNIQEDLRRYRMIFLSGPRQVECKLQQRQLSKAITYYAARLPAIRKFYQLHLTPAEMPGDSYDLLEGRVQQMSVWPFLDEVLGI